MNKTSTANLDTEKFSLSAIVKLKLFLLTASVFITGVFFGIYLACAFIASEVAK